MATTKTTPSPEQQNTQGKGVAVMKQSSRRQHAVHEAKEEDVDVPKISSRHQSKENTPTKTRGKHTHKVKEKVSPSIAKKDIKTQGKADNLKKHDYDRTVIKKQTGAGPYGSAPSVYPDPLPSAAGPRYLHVGDHVVVCSEYESEHTYANQEAEEVNKGNEEDHSSNDHTKPENAEGCKDPDEEIGFAYRAKERVMEMWSECKSNKVCWLAILGCGLLVVASVVIAGILATQITSDGRVALGSNRTMVLEPSTPWTTTFYEENNSAFDGFIVVDSTPISVPFTNISVTDVALPITATFLLTTDMKELECAKKTCKHGTCKNKDGGYRCACSPGWTGQNCQQDIDECAWSPCQHGGCVNKNGGYKCTCSPGWTGQNCNQDIDECALSPCQHGGCVNKNGGYKCTCSPGWTGQNCNQDIDECALSPCQHGRCVNKNGGYKCTCSPGWTGQNCNQDINECKRNPCRHGRCVNKDGGYKCTCSLGWTGQDCQRVLKCPGDWRKYNNHCYKLMTTTVSWSTARSRCRQHGAMLTSINGQGENNFVKNLISGCG
uniref:EGF-like domain-containing protein n=1 Tax=Branchiostoma floridae TaxID=7739 RepID=C3Y4J0_BRAFL|eukprot:XP_002608637.1 hypothetical protein BRAFLDRAFT_97687 [Branchiostoma floridae]